MPVYYHSSPQKSNGFSIDDLIKTSSITYPSPSYLSPITWLPPSPSNIYQSMLQYLRQTNQFSHPSTAAFFLNTYRKPKRNRTAFTPTQLLKLENEFEKNPYIVGQERKELAKHLNLPESKVKVWYQNRRTKQKRLKTDDHDHLNESDTIIKIDDEHSCNDPLQQVNSCSN